MTAAPEGRKLLRLEIRNAETPIERKPEWIKTKAKMGPEYTALHSLVKSEDLHTVCQEAGCPNIYECWEDREATFLIGGSQCTRRCDFCQIDTGKPDAYDTDEPRRVAESVVRMNLRYATVTSVVRDDLPDTSGRASKICPRNAGLITKSNLILGMGEEPEEVVQALNDLHEAGCDIITITQYLRPTPRHLPVARWVKPAEFVEFKEEAERIGFLGVLAGPLVRSSYRAGRLWAQSMVSKGRQIPDHLAHIADSADLGFAQAV
jgi:lipoate synthase